MNDLDYLNQISANVTPSKQATGGFFDKKTKMIAIILGAVLLIAIILMIAMSSAPSEPTTSDELDRIYQRTNSLEETVTEYSKNLKSSTLRSSAASLSTLLANMKSSTESFLDTKYGAKPAKEASADDTKLIEDTTTTLEKARLNGILDRYFAKEMYYQIEKLLILENAAAKKTSDEEIIEFLQSTFDSLSRLSDTFDNFSEAD